MNSWRYWLLFCYQRISLDDKNGYAAKFNAFFIAMAAPKPFNDLFKYDVTLFAACIVALSHAKIFTPLRII